MGREKFITDTGVAADFRIWRLRTNGEGQCVCRSEEEEDEAGSGG